MPPPRPQDGPSLSLTQAAEPVDTDETALGGLPSVTRSDRLAERVYEVLQQGIFGGVLEPGARLSVPLLAQRLRVSRSPVREAVQRLIQDRLAVEQPQGGAVVARLSRDDLAELYEVREALEGKAAALAARRADPAALEELERTLIEHEAAVGDADLDRSTVLDMRFHALMREAARNRHLRLALDDIQMQIRLAMTTTMVTAGPALAVRDHRWILEAVRQGQPEEAERRAREHIARLREALR